MSMFGERVRVLRIKHGLTQAQLADAISKSMGKPFKRSALGNYERGIREPDLDTVEAFADYFDTSVSDILGREEEETERKQNVHLTTQSVRGSKEWRVLSEGLEQTEQENPQLFKAIYTLLTTAYPDTFKERTDDDDPKS